MEAKKSSQEKQYDVYLSYSGSDREIVNDLVAKLESESVSVWWDQVLPAGKQTSSIEENLAVTQSLLLCVGERGMESQYQLEEMFSAFALKKRVLPVRLPGFPGYEKLPVGMRKSSRLSSTPSPPTDNGRR